MFTVASESKTIVDEIRHLPTAVFRALTESEERDADVTLTGESGGCQVRAVYRRGARVEFLCCDAADRKEG